MGNKSVEQEQMIRKYFKKKYNLKLTERDYREIAQSLHYLGKAIHFYLIKFNR